MNSKELEIWLDGVCEHTSQVKNLIDERREFKRIMEEHLRQFFDGFSEIDFSQKFDVIKLEWAYNHSPIIKNEKLAELGMDWEICSEMNCDAFHVVLIKVYPYGIPDRCDTGD